MASLVTQGFEHKSCEGLDSIAGLKQPVRDHWLELKFDGFRLAFERHADGVSSYTRSFKRQDGKLPYIDEWVSRMPVGTVIDGEIVALRKRNGFWQNDFEYVQSVMLSKPDRAVHLATKRPLDFVAFDLPFLMGQDLRDEPLHERRRLLQRLFHEYVHPRVSISRMYPCRQDTHDRFLELGLEGSVIKHRDSLYRGSKGWHKIKGAWDLDAVVVGFVDGSEGTRWHGKVGGIEFGQPVPATNGVCDLCGAGVLASGEHIREDLKPCKDILRVVDGVTYIVRGSCKCGTDELHEAISADRDSYMGRVLTVKHNGAYKDDPQSVRHPQFKKWRPDKLTSQVTWHDR